MLTRHTIAQLVTALSLLCTSTSLAQFTLDWHTIDGGGAMFSTGGTFSLGGTTGQPDAGPVLTGGTFEFVGGFWPVAAISQSPPCPGDLDGDGVVDLSDLAALLSNFGTPSGATLAEGDIDADGDVDLSDLALLLAHFGTTCP